MDNEFALKEVTTVGDFRELLNKLPGDFIFIFVNESKPTLQVLPECKAVQLYNKEDICNEMQSN